MINLLRRGITALSVALGIVAIGISSVAAQSNNQSNSVANGFRISPVRSEFTIDKGRSQTITVTVENPTDIATTAKAVVNDFVSSDDETGTPRLILDETVQSPKNSFKSLVGSIPDLELGPKQKKDVDVKLSIPANANAGGYYGAIRFLPSNGTQQGNVGLTASVGTIVLVTVPGNLVEKVNLLQLSAAQNGKAKRLFTSGDVQILTRLKNDGDIHLKPFGRIEVKNMFGKSVSTFEFNNTDPRANVLPGSVRKFVNDISETKMLGRYTVTANLGYSQGSGDLISAKASFWYLPAWSLAVLLAILVALSAGIYFLLRKFRPAPNHRAKR